MYTKPRQEAVALDNLQRLGLKAELRAADAADTARAIAETITGPVDTLIHNAAILRVEPGWVEVCFEPDQVDTRIRRLALDLDPGWVPLCNAVVRFRYA